MTPVAAVSGQASRGSLAGKTAWSGAASFSGLLGRLIAGIIIARLLGPDGTGRIAYLVWIVETANLIANLGLQTSLTRYLAELSGQGKHESLQGFAVWIYTRYLLLAVMGAAAVGVIAQNLASPSQPRGIWLLLCLLFLSRGMASIYLAYLSGRQQFRLVARINVVSSVCLVTGVALGILSFGLRGALMGYLIGSVLPAACSLIMLRGVRLVSRPDRALRRRVWKYALNTWLAAVVSACVWSRMEIAFIQHYWTDHEVAMFSVGIGLAMVVSQAATLFCGAFMAHFSELCGMRDRDAIQRNYATATRLMALVVFPMSFGGAAITPVLLPLVYGAEFAPAVPNAMVLLAASAMSFTLVGSALVYAMERSRFIALGGFFGAVLSLATCVLVIPRFGAWGAVWSRSAVQCSMIALGTWYITRRMHFSFPFRALARTLLSAVLCGGAAWCLIRGWDSPAALVLGVPVSAAVYVLAVRSFRVMNSDDARSLRNVLGRIPFPVRVPMLSVLNWVDARTQA